MRPDGLAAACRTWTVAWPTYRALPLSKSGVNRATRSSYKLRPVLKKSQIRWRREATSIFMKAEQPSASFSDPMATRGDKHLHEGRAAFWCTTRRLLFLHSSLQPRRPFTQACMRCTMPVPAWFMCCLMLALVDSCVLADIAAGCCIQRRGAAGGCRTSRSMH